MKDNSDLPSLINFPEWKIYTDRNDQKKSDKALGVRLRKILKRQDITQPEMAKRLEIKFDRFKKILSGEISVRKNKNLIGKIAREFGINEKSIFRNLGMPVNNVCPPKLTTITEAKEEFAKALLESDNYLDFFIAVFMIAQNYNVSYKVTGDAESEQKLNDLDAVRRLKNFEQGQYAEFALELMSEYAGAGARKKIARKFLESKLIRSLSRKDWKDILRNADPSMLRVWFEVLDEMEGDRKI